MSRMYGFNAPHERVEPRFWKSTQDFSHVNAGPFVRNSVLSGMCYGDNFFVSSFLKSCDLVHPMCGYEDYEGTALSVYGGVADSVNSAASLAAVKSVLAPWNSSIVWAPGGNGANSWIGVRLPEASLCESYLVASTASTCPLSWRLEGSLDGMSWAVLHTVENTGVWGTSREEKVFTVPEESRGVYLWYRLYVTASNASAMSISTFRLFRPASVCGRGELLIDASAASPLVLSFMDGFGSDTVTPSDFTESVSSPTVRALGLFDSYGTPVSALTSPTPVEVYAKRTDSGSVEFELCVAADSDVPYLPGAMTSYSQNGMVCSFTIGGDGYYPAYIRWGDGNRWSSMPTYLYHGDSILKRADEVPFFVSKIYGCSYGEAGVWTRCVAEELDGSFTYLANQRDYSTTYMLNRLVKSLRYQGSTTSQDAYRVGSAVYSHKYPLRYRCSGGKLYQRSVAAGSSWEAVRKVKLGSFVAKGGDLYQVSPVKPWSLYGMVAGDVNLGLDM